MHTNRVDVFHIADRDTVACTVAHHLILNFLPACNTPLHQNLPYPGKAKAVCQNLLQLDLVAGDAAAGAAKRISRPEHHRIADFIRKRHSVLDIFHHKGRGTRLPDLLHRLLKLQSVLRLADGFRRGAEKQHAMRRQKAGLIQLHPKI